MTPAQFVAQNESQWWLDKLTLSQVRKLIVAQTGTKITLKECKAFLQYHCSIYKVLKRKPQSKQKSLTADQWDNLKFAVLAMKPYIESGGIKRAVAFVSTRVSTNAHQLKGLPSRFHYWDMV